MSDCSKVTQLPGTSSQANRDELPERVVDALFRDLLLKYGVRWADLWNGLPMPEVKAQWGRDLGVFDVQTIKRALDALSGPYPPLLPEFRDLCKTMRPRRETWAPPALNDSRRVEPETMRKIHEILGKK